MKRILGLDLGTNSIGWALTQQDFIKKEGEIKGVGSRILPMSQDVLGKFDSGVSISQTAERNGYRGVRILLQRSLLRRERLHRVLNILNFLPAHYSDSIDFKNKYGQFKKNTEVKLNYRKKENGKYEFIFINSFNEMVKDFERKGQNIKIPYDWTLYYLRTKALTQKITKEELSWVILNFNQKRGYYQLRGEEEELVEGKKKEFLVLKVKELKDTGEVIKKTGDKLYQIIFENGWIYDKPIVKKENWLNKSKEFIVTTSIKKDGNIKRTYKAVDSEKDWIAIKKKTEQSINNSKKTVGQYIYETLLIKPNQKIRGKLIKTIERKYYKDEFKQILEEQIKHHKELQNRKIYDDCVQELYSRNEAHQNNIKDNDFNYLFTEDIIFYQRPLKSKKSTISNCQYEYRSFNKLVEIDGVKKTVKSRNSLKAISKSHPLFQEFRLWQFLKNLKIYQNVAEIDSKTVLDIDITNQLLKTEDEWVDLFDFLNTKKEIEQHQLLTYFSNKKLIPKQKKEKPNYRWNYVVDKKYPTNPTKALLLTRLSKVNGVEINTFLTKKNEQQLWHIIYSVKDKKEYEQALKTFARKKNIAVDAFFDNFKKIPPFKSDYGAFSEKAIKKILPLMRRGKYWDESIIPVEVKDRVASIIERVENVKFDKNHKNFNDELNRLSDDDIPKRLLKSFIDFKEKNPLTSLNTYQACYAIYNRFTEVSVVTYWKTPMAITEFLDNFKQHSLRNPIVEQVVTETLRTVRDIWEFYGEGKEKFFDEIHIELGREMKNPAGKRESMSKRNIDNENTNHRIKEILKELKNEGINDIKPYSPSQQEILKIYEEGVLKNPDVKYNDKYKEDDIDKIRKKSSPSKTDISKYKLWLQQGYISPYTGMTIPLSKLFTTDYQIEHIIPQSRYYDNSLSNKIICESEVNQLKDNQTAYEFIKKQGTQKVDLGQGKTVTLFNLETYEKHCNQYFKNNRGKLKKLLSEDIPEGFINRQLNDSRYISKLIKGLLSNLVREEDEQEATSKNIVPVTGSITSKLKQDWGLNDKWNEIIAPRFKRLNELTKTNDFGYWDEKINAFRTQVPDEIAKGFSKKRIDHRHHALDAIVIACCTKKHTNYLGALNAEKKNYGLRDSLLIKNEKGDYTKHFLKPWKNFTTETKSNLEKTIISFKQNIRVINKTNNKTWQWVEKDGRFKKELVRQTKGDNWAIRKPLHKETVSGKINMPAPKGKIATASRVLLSEIKTQKHLEKITDKSIQRILEKHLNNYLDDKEKKQFDLAFNQDGLEELNKNIKALNNGKNHHPIYKVRLFEIGSKFIVGNQGNKKDKYVEAAKGTNLFFAIYYNKEKNKREYETIPLNRVIEHQKLDALLSKKERTPVPIDVNKGQFLFSLSPNDLVYVPTDDEMENPNAINFNNITKEQVSRIYKMVSTTQNKLQCIQSNVAISIQNKFEFSSLNKMERDIEGNMIKDRCWKLKVDRLGNIIKIIK
ncbi:MAG TPA: CRISPR-associated protein Csn1 [Crocinitomix sp.]|nr:CRISPR-associated protein Csn1 [Bacteroidia bacterium]HIP36215.1 CRISPR-associated protein Csn1 [Crocinitomix sp.]